MEGVLDSQTSAARRQASYWKLALVLAGITIAYNLIEGVVAMYFGATDELLTLFGFGLDSFAEVLSGVGILHLVLRSRSQGNISARDRFERISLRVTAISFYVLGVGLVVGGGLSIWTGHKPDGSLPGLIVAGLSIGTMYALYRAKLRAGNALDSAAMIADAKCTRSCLQLSYILLAASALYAMFQVPYVDAVGSLALAFFVFREGRETQLQSRATATLGCSDCC